MPTSIPVATKNPGDLLTSALWNGSVRDNINKLLSRGHRILTVAQFTALAADVEDGDEVYLEVDAANGILWHLRYVTAETTYKWRFLGGRPMFSEVVTAESTTSTTYAALTTAGPTIALPRAGDYDVEHGFHSSATGATIPAHMSYDIGGTAAVDADDCQAQNNATQNGNFRRRRKAALTTASLTSKYRSDSAGTTWFGKRHLAVFPTRIRHDA